MKPLHHKIFFNWNHHISRRLRGDDCPSTFTEHQCREWNAGRSTRVEVLTPLNPTRNYHRIDCALLDGALLILLLHGKDQPSDLWRLQVGCQRWEIRTLSIVELLEWAEDTITAWLSTHLGSLHLHLLDQREGERRWRQMISDGRQLLERYGHLLEWAVIRGDDPDKARRLRDLEESWWVELDDDLQPEQQIKLTRCRGLYLSLVCDARQEVIYAVDWRTRSYRSGSSSVNFGSHRLTAASEEQAVCLFLAQALRHEGKLYEVEVHGLRSGGRRCAQEDLYGVPFKIWAADEHIAAFCIVDSAYETPYPAHAETRCKLLYDPATEQGQVEEGFLHPDAFTVP